MGSVRLLVVTIIISLFLTACAEDANKRPVADAGASLTVHTTDTVSLDGSASFDPEGRQSLNFTWTLVSKPAGSTLTDLTNGDTNAPSFVPDANGDYLIALVVGDGRRFSTPDEITITAVNTLPVADPGVDQTVHTTTLVSLDGSASSDADSDPITAYNWSIVSKPAGSSVSALTGADTATPNFVPDANGDYVIELVVSDGIDSSVAATTTVTAVNTIPAANAGADITAHTTSLVTLSGAGSDADGDAIATYQWSLTSAPVGSSVNTLAGSDTASPTFTPDLNGTYVAELIVNDGLENSTVDSVVITAVNTLPLAHAGLDQTIHTTTTVTLDGSGSDADGDSIVAYNWVMTGKPAGSTASLSDNTLAAPTFVADKNGTYTLALVVSDGIEVGIADTVVVTATNALPIANAGADQTIHTTKTVTLNGSGSDAESDPIVSYSWVMTGKPAGSTAVLSDAAVAAPSFVVDKNGAYTLSLVVSDGIDLSVADTVLVTAVNALPVADAGIDQTVHTTETVTLSGSATDSDGDAIVAYSWVMTAKPAGSTAALSDTTVTNPTFVADQNGDYTLTLMADDGIETGAVDTVVITATNTLPVANAGLDQTIHTTQTVSLGGSATDGDGDAIVAYTWTMTDKPVGSAAVLSDTAVTNPTFVADLNGIYTLTLVADDGIETGLADTVVITATNILPVADAGLDQTIHTTQTVSLGGSATDGDGDAIVAYTWTMTGKPAGSAAVLSDTSVTNPTFVADQNGTYTLTLVADDGIEVSLADTVVITAVNTLPVADAGVAQQVHNGDTVLLSGSASDSDADPITSYSWTIQSVPAGSAVGSLIGANTATPSFATDVKGEYVLALVVNDGIQDSLPSTVTVSSNGIPTANAGVDLTVHASSEVILDGSASSDPDGDVISGYTWTVTSVPAGSSVSALTNANTVAPSFVPDLIGQYELTLVVSDGIDASPADTMLVNAENTVPVANAGANMPAHTGSVVNLSGGASSDADGDSLTYAWAISAQPTGSAISLAGANTVSPNFTPLLKGDYVFSLVVNDGLQDSLAATVTFSANSLPVANAGLDQVVHTLDLVALDGAASSDGDGDALTYSWSFVSKPATSTAAFSSATAVAPTFTVDKNGVYEVQLIVNDGIEDSVADTVLVVSSNTAPVANAGLDQNVHTSDTIFMDGSASSDADGDTLSYSWSFTANVPAGTAAVINNANTANPNFVPDKNGTYEIQLIVNDGFVDSLADTVLITGSNIAPVANAGADQAVNTGDLVSLTGSGTDADADAIAAYTWTFASKPAGSVAVIGGADTATPTFTPDRGGVFVLALVVSDGVDVSLADTVAISVNTIPVANAGIDQSIHATTTVTLNGSGSDADGDAIASYAWTMDSKPASSAAILSNTAVAGPTFVADIPGTYTLSLVVTDGLDSSIADSVIITATNALAQANAGLDQAVHTTETVTLNGSATDADGDTIASYSWSFVGIPAGSTATLSDSAVTNPTFVADKNGTYTLSLMVNDGIADGVADTVIIEATNALPVANAGLDATVHTTTTVTLNGSATDADNDAIVSYSWSFVGMPLGSTATLSNSAVTNPSFVADKNGTYTLNLMVNDGIEDSIADTVVIQATNNLPVVNAGVDQIVHTTDVVSLGAIAVDADMDPIASYTWTMTAQPVGSTATLSDAAVANPTFVADKNGTYTLSLVANDGIDDSLADEIIITATNALPVANAGTDQTVHTTNLVNLNGSASDSDGDTIVSYTWTLVSKPAGSLAAVNDPALTNPSFTADKNGSYTLELVAYDGIEMGLADTVVIVAANNLPEANAGADQAVHNGDTVLLSGSASDFDGDPIASYSWSIKSVPAGSAVATLTGANTSTPSFATDVKGAYVLGLIVNDGIDDSLESTVTISSNGVPVAAAGADQTVHTTTLVSLSGVSSSDPDADPIVSYSWTISTKPAGSALSALTGATTATPSFVPDANGVYVLALVVNDGVEDSPADTVQVTATNIVPVANAGAAQAVHTGDLVTLNGLASSDGDGDTLSYSWTVASEPVGSSIVLTAANTAGPSFTPLLKGDYVLSLVVSDGLENSLAANVTVSANTPPVANAGIDQIIHTTDTVNLDGSASSDADSDGLTYSWSFVSKPAGSAAALLNATLVNSSFVADKNGDYVLQLIVHDGVESSAADTMLITATNALPVANAGIDQTVHTTDTVLLSGTGSSDADGDAIASYSWVMTGKPAGSTAVLNDAAVAEPTFVADKNGDYTLTLVVGDGIGLSTADTVVITAQNTLPVANAGSNQVIHAGQQVSLSGSGTDADSDAIAGYSWTVQSAPVGSTATFSDAAIANPTFVPDLVGSFVLALVVNDGIDDSMADTVTITSTNIVPVADAGVGQMVAAGDTVQLNGGGSSDGDGDSLTYSWTLTPPVGSVSTLSSTSAVAPTFVADIDGDYMLSLTVSDNWANSTTVYVTVIANGTRVSSGIVAPIAIPDNDVATGASNIISVSGGPNPIVNVEVTLDITHPNVGDLDIVLESPLGTLVTLSSDNGGIGDNYTKTTFTDFTSEAVIYASAPFTGKFSPEESLSLFNGEDSNGSWTLHIYDDAAGDIGTLNSWSLVFLTTTPPVANAGADQVVQVGDLVTLDGSASSDIDGDPISYSWTLSSMPVGSAAVLDTTVVDAPTFTADVAGLYAIDLVVNDGTVSSVVDTVVVYTATQSSSGIAAENLPNNDPLIGVSKTITVSGQGNPVSGISLELDITHAWDSDLRAVLRSPSGTEVILFNAVGGSGAHFTGTLLSDYAETSIADGVAPFAGTFRPVEALATFNGEDANGDWVLTVYDQADHGVYNQGSFNAWTLKLQDAETPVASAGQDQMVATGATVQLDGSASTLGTYYWHMVSSPAGSKAALSDLNAVNPTFVADQDGVYVVSLMVSDGVSDSVVDTVRVTAITGLGTAYYTAGSALVNVPDADAVTGLSSTIDATGSPDAITSVKVYLDLKHTYDGDLKILLEAPDGTTIILSSLNGAAGHDYASTIFDDGAATLITSGSAPFTGTYAPQNALSGLAKDYSAEANRNWTLRIYDTTSGGAGYLKSWVLVLD